ncbi:MAG TPA: outer membrane beta-barrel protein [Puia sp.]|nr:outer membrane beta-barrel protein [Puia sp.]
MKKSSLLLLGLLVIVSQLFAQGPPAGGAPGGSGGVGGPGNGGPGGGGPGGGGLGGGSNGHLYGKLVDSSGRGIGKASVLIIKVYTDKVSGKKKETLLKGLSSQNNGDFSAEDLPVGTPLKVSLSAVGYTAVTQDVVLKPGASDMDLGKLAMMPSSNELQQVVVTASKPTISVDQEKKVFNVSKDIVSVGGTGLDIMKNVPSVNVDIDGNVTIRGGSPQLFVDGKPTTLTLDEIPSDAIESVEVITNPSAKYDASGGGAGILNIVLKKNRKKGYNGSIRAGGDSYGGLNGGASLNVREGKFNVSADINGRTLRDRVTGGLVRQDFSTSPSTNLFERELDTSKGNIVFERVGLDYFITNKTTLSLTGFAMQHKMGTQTSNLEVATDSLYTSGTTPGYYQEEISAGHTFNGRGGTLGFKQLFARDKEEWTADASYFSGNATSHSLYATDYYTGVKGSALGSTELQKILGGGNDHNVILQTDFSDPLTPKTTLEAGLRAALQSRLNLNNNYTYDADSAAYELVPSAASNYKSQNNVYAAYATIGSSFGGFSYKAGLRAESSNYHGTLLNSGETFSNQYPVSLFPSLFLGEKLGNGGELQLSYTRRVNRPNFMQLVPYTDSSNKLNITRGNPNLVPEFTQSLELSYIKTFPGNNTLMGSVYYKHTDHLITGYIESDTNSAGTVELINTYINAETSDNMGAELTAQLSLTKWWDFTANVNLYHSKINVGWVDATEETALWSWFGKANTNFKLPAGFAIQVSGIYQSKSNLPVNTNSNQPGPPNMQSSSASQGYIKAYYDVDMAVKKTFMQGKLVASASWSDIFRSRSQEQYSYSTYFTQDYSRLRDPQLLRLNLSWNFGKVDASLFKRKNNNVQGEDQ